MLFATKLLGDVSPPPISAPVTQQCVTSGIAVQSGRHSPTLSSLNQPHWSRQGHSCWSCKDLCQTYPLWYGALLTCCLSTASTERPFLANRCFLTAFIEVVELERPGARRTTNISNDRIQVATSTSSVMTSGYDCHASKAPFLP